MKTLSDFLLVIAAIASMAMSAFGLSVGVWGEFPKGTGAGGILDLLLWLLPALSVFAFVSYLISKSVGLTCAWTIAIGSTLTSICGLASGQSPIIFFLLPLIQFIVCFALYGDARLQRKIARGLASSAKDGG